MVHIVALAFGALAAVAWLVAIVSWILALGHRAEGVSLATLLFHGIKSFDPASFDAEGQVHHKRFLVGFAAFFIAAMIAGAFGAASGS